jgi:hypothetical protein
VLVVPVEVGQQVRDLELGRVPDVAAHGDHRPPGRHHLAGRELRQAEAFQRGDPLPGRQ